MDVTVIIPTFNRLWCLPKAIDSCRNTICRTQIIVIDDGSTDGTWVWLQTQPDVLSIYQPNQGQTYAINNGFNSALGKYVRFLDSDDYLEKGIIDDQFRLAEEDNADIVVSNVAEYDFKEQKIINKNFHSLFWDDFMEIQLSNKYGSHFLGMLFIKDLVQKIPRRPDFAYREDRMFLLEIALLKPKVVYLAITAGYWVKHPNQMQSNYQGLKAIATNLQHLNIYRKILDLLYIQSELTENRKKAACTVLWPLANWIAKTHIPEAVAVRDWIYDLNPNFIIPEQGALGWLHRNLGFEFTVKILNVRRKMVFGLWN